MAVVIDLVNHPVIPDTNAPVATAALQFHAARWTRRYGKRLDSLKDSEGMRPVKHLQLLSR